MIVSTAWLLGLATLLQSGTATVSGVVRDESTGEPLAGASVTLPDLRRGAATTIAGRYTFGGVPPGPHHLTVRGFGYAPRTLDVIVPPSGDAVFNLTLRPVPLSLTEIVVRPQIPLRGDARDKSSEAFVGTILSAAALRNHPLLAEPDAFGALVGGDVVMRPEAPAGLHVRGGGSDQVAFLLDGIPILSPYHSADAFTAWNPDGIERVELRSIPPLTRGPASLTGVVVAETRPPMLTPHLVGALSTTQGRLSLNGKLPLNSGFLLSGRMVGWLNGTGSGATSHQGGSDWLAKLESGVFGGTLSALQYENRNQVRTAVAAQDDPEGSSTTEEVALYNQFSWISRSTGLSWAGQVAGNALLDLRVWQASGDATAEWRPADMVAERLGNRRRDRGLLAVLDWTAGSRSTSVGLRVDRSTTSYRINSQQLRRADHYRLEGTTSAVTGFLEQTRPLGERLRANIGLRATWASGKGYIAPQLSIRGNAEPLEIELGFARTFQFEQSLRNPESVLSLSFPADLFVGAGTPTVPVARGDQISGAVALRLAAGKRVGALAYIRRMSGLVLVAPATGAPFATRGFDTGSGTAHGAALDLTMSGARYALTSSYGFEQVRLTYGDTTFVPGFAARHLAHAGIVAFPVATASLRASVTAMWDRRSSAAVGSFDWDSCTSALRGCDFSGSPAARAEPLGATRLPAYVRLDLGARKHWHLRLGTEEIVLGTFASVMDVFGRANAFLVSQDPVSGSREWVQAHPRAPLTFGIDWRY